MRLTDETGQDDENFVNKMDEMARRISGTESAPIDLYTFAATAFIDCEVLQFHMKTKFLNDLFGSNPKAMSVDKIIRTLKNKIWYINYQVLQSPSKVNKVYTEGDMDVLKLAMNEMV